MIDYTKEDMTKLNEAISRRELEIKALKRIKRLCLDNKITRVKAGELIQNALDNFLFDEKKRRF